MKRHGGQHVHQSFILTCANTRSMCQHEEVQFVFHSDLSSTLALISFKDSCLKHGQPVSRWRRENVSFASAAEQEAADMISLRVMCDKHVPPFRDLIPHLGHFSQGNYTGR